MDDKEKENKRKGEKMQSRAILKIQDQEYEEKKMDREITKRKWAWEILRQCDKEYEEKRERKSEEEEASTHQKRQQIKKKTKGKEESAELSDVRATTW